MDPDFQGAGVPTVNVDGKEKKVVRREPRLVLCTRKKREGAKIYFLSIPVSLASKSMHPSKLFPMTSYVTRTFTLFSTTAMTQTKFSSTLRWAFRCSTPNSKTKILRLSPKLVVTVRTLLVPVSVPHSTSF